MAGIERVESGQWHHDVGALSGVEGAAVPSDQAEVAEEEARPSAERGGTQTPLHLVTAQLQSRLTSMGLAGSVGSADPLGEQGGRSAPGPAFGSPELQALLDRDTGSVTRAGNNVEMLFDGVSSFAERNRLIDGAQNSIHLQTFIFTDDETGWDLARRLSGKAREGVAVRVIYDGLGSNRSDDALFEHMRSHGVEVREYGDPLRQFWDLNNRWHEKHLIVDGEVSIEGGMNIADEYAFGGSGRMVLGRGELGRGSEPWRDADMRLEGPSVHDAQRAFLANWVELGPGVPETAEASLFPTPTEVADGPKVRVVQHRPDEDGDDHTKHLYLHALRSVEKSVSIENAYFVPSPEIQDALISAARRGVDVRVLTNSRASSDLGFVSDAARYHYDDLVAAGVKIYEKQGSTLHAKTATFDGVFSIVGSVNMNGRSEGLDSEAALAVDDAGVAAELERRLEQGLPEAEEITTAALREGGFFTNLQQWSLSLFSWTF